MTSTYETEQVRNFEKLESFLGFQKPKSIYTSNELAGSIVNSIIGDTEVSLYKLDNGFEIIREQQVDKSEMPWRGGGKDFSSYYSGSKGLIGRESFPSRSYVTTTNRYYFINKGEVVEDIGLAVALVEKATGIRLYMHPSAECEKLTSSVVYEICTQIPSYSVEDNDYFGHRGQPTDEELESDTTKVIKSIDTGKISPNDFGLTFGQFVSLADKLKMNAAVNYAKFRIRN